MIPHRPGADALPEVGLGVLSWRGYASLDPMLAALASSGVRDVFGETVVFLPEVEPQGEAIAERHGFSHAGSRRNLGILGGFQALARSLTTPHVVLLENDIYATAGPAEVAAQIAHGVRLIEEGRAQVVQVRDRRDPGEPFTGKAKYARYWPARDAPFATRATAAARRLLRPGKASRLIGISPYVETDPCERFPHAAASDEAGFVLMSSRYRNWSNQPFLIERRFYLDVLLDYAASAPTTRRVNGFRNVEIELNGRWWREQDFTIAIAPGLFTHKRIGERGY